MVFQDFLKYPLSAEDNIKLGNYDDFSNDNKMFQSAYKTGVHDFVKILPNQYKTILQNEWQEGTGLSYGQWQKLAISRAYFSDASIIIMDEPASSLDAYAENILTQEINDIMKHKTTIMIFHRYTTAKMVNKIIVIDNNTIVEQGTFSQLLEKQGKFAQMFFLQAEKYGIV